MCHASKGTTAHNFGNIKLQDGNRNFQITPKYATIANQRGGFFFLPICRVREQLCSRSK